MFRHVQECSVVRFLSTPHSLKRSPHCKFDTLSLFGHAGAHVVHKKWDLDVDFGVRKIECSALMWTEEIMMHTRKIATIFMSIASKKHTRFCFSWYWQIYLAIIKYTESEKSLRGVLQELWYNIPPGTITSLRADNRLPSTDPYVVNSLRQFDSPFNFHTNYGQRLTGYLQVLSSNIIFSVKFGHILCL